MNLKKLRRRWSCLKFPTGSIFRLWINIDCTNKVTAIKSYRMRNKTNNQKLSSSDIIIHHRNMLRESVTLKNQDYTHVKLVANNLCGNFQMILRNWRFEIGQNAKSSAIESRVKYRWVCAIRHISNTSISGNCWAPINFLL